MENFVNFKKKSLLFSLGVFTTCNKLIKQEMGSKIDNVCEKL